MKNMNISGRFFVVFLCIAPIAAGTVSQAQAASVSTVSNRVTYSVLHKLGDVLYKFSENIFDIGEDIYDGAKPGGAYKKQNKSKLSHGFGLFLMEVGISVGKNTMKLNKLENEIFSKMNHIESQRILTLLQSKRVIERINII